MCLDFYAIKFYYAVPIKCDGGPFSNIECSMAFYANPYISLGVLGTDVLLTP